MWNQRRLRKVQFGQGAKQRRPRPRSPGQTRWNNNNNNDNNCRKGGSGGGRVRGLAVASCLLLENIYGVFVLHLQLCRGVRLVYRLSIEPEADLPYRETLSFAVGLHEFAERSVPFDFELDHGAVLSGHFQVDVVVFSFHSLLGFILGHVGLRVVGVV